MKEFDFDKVLKKYNMIFAILTLSLIVVCEFLRNFLGHFFQYVGFVFIMLEASVSYFLYQKIKYYFIFKSIICPECGKNYFELKMYDRTLAKDILKKDPLCIHCNSKLEFKSELKTLL